MGKLPKVEFKGVEIKEDGLTLLELQEKKQKAYLFEPCTEQTLASITKDFMTFIDTLKTKDYDYLLDWRNIKTPLEVQVHLKLISCIFNWTNLHTECQRNIDMEYRNCVQEEDLRLQKNLKDDKILDIQPVDVLQCEKE